MLDKCFLLYSRCYHVFCIQIWTLLFYLLFFFFFLVILKVCLDPHTLAFYLSTFSTLLCVSVSFGSLPTLSELNNKIKCEIQAGMQKEEFFTFTSSFLTFF